MGVLDLQLLPYSSGGEFALLPVPLLPGVLEMTTPPHLHPAVTRPPSPALTLLQ